MKIEAKLLAITLFLLGLSIALAWSEVASAQKAERGTQQWKLPIKHEQFSIRVIDTSGVCLYVLLPSFSNNAATIAAVPKTQLPQGAGCQ